MAKQIINIGSAPNDSTGDPLRTAFSKINNNFDELYSEVGNSNFRFSQNTMTTTEGNINIAPADGAAVVTGSQTQVYISAANASIDMDTGALVVAGGVGISGNVNIGGLLYAASAQIDALDDTPIGSNSPSTGTFTTVTASMIDVSNTLTVNTIDADSINSVTYTGGTVNVDQIIGNSATIGNIVVPNANIINLTTSNITVTGGNISGVSISITGLENTPIGVTTPNTAVFTEMTTANAQITGGSISGVNISPVSVNGAPIGNSSPSTGAFTTLTASGATTFTSSTTSTSTSTGGVVLSGGMGVAGNINAGGNVSGVVVSASSNGAGTNFKIGDDAWIGDININNTMRVMGQQDNTKGYIVFGTGDNSSLGRSSTGALTYTGDFTAGAFTGASLSAGTIGNVGATLTGTLQTAAQPNITSVGTLSGLEISGTANVTTINGSFKGPFNGTVGATTANAGTFTDVTVNGTLTVSNNNIIGNVTGNLTGVASSATTAGTATYASTAGLATAATTVVQPAQGNITSLGILTSIQVTGTSILTGGISSTGDISTTGNIGGLIMTGLNLGSFGNVEIQGGNLKISSSFTIGSSIGSANDIKGKIVWDSGYVYVCTADYDGITPIWKRATLGSF
jgi:hypothetical protein